MGFQLIISQGGTIGREYAFDQSAVLIGRVEACDVILKEEGVSRRHARIAHEAEGYCLEDLGSVNGTTVNGEAPNGYTALRDGDSISIGSVTLKFRTDVTGPIVDQLMAPPALGPGDTNDDSTQPRALIPAPARAPVRVSAPRSSVTRSSPPRTFSAADRSRYRRSGMAGHIALWWGEARLPARSLAIVAVALCLGLGAAGIVRLAAPDETNRLPPEPTVLSPEPITASFGLGLVTYERADSKSFDFEIRAPVQVMVVLHYQAREISSKNEVSINVNGVELGWVPPDTLDTERTLEVLIPAKVVKRDAVNTVTFDNVHNPPESEPWQVSNLWLEVAMLPEKNQLGLIADAEEKFQRGNRDWRQRDIGAANRWSAYKNFREAWLTLEAIPSGERPPTYQLTREMMAEARRALDEKCRELLLKARSAYNFGKLDDARKQLDHILDFFPNRAHPCQARAQFERQEMNL